MMVIKFIFRFALFFIFVQSVELRSMSNIQHVYEDIESKKETAEKIIDYVLNGSAKGQVYRRLAAMVDKFGYRMCGTPNLEASIDYMVEQLRKDGLENVHKEAVKVPRWVRGREAALLVAPRVAPLAVMGLGYSVGTPAGGVTAPVMVVKTFDELRARADEAKGKIVVFNQAWEGYSTSVQYRTGGASAAGRAGAVAALVRSVTGRSVYSPHTGQMAYEPGVRKIPCACITVEDAEMLLRMTRRGVNVTVTLYMEAHTLPDALSYNTVAEIRGWKYPEQVVLVSGHQDSWDVGQGAMDDGGGAFISWAALSLVKQLGLRPKRTMRVVLWTCEEMGEIGGQEYFRRHSDQAHNLDIVMESDEGTFTPQGLQFTGGAAARRVMRRVAQTLLAGLNATELAPGASLPDVGAWTGVGVPGASIKTANGHYFDFHHSRGDAMTVETPRDLDLCAAVWAVTSWALADLEHMLPARRMREPTFRLVDP